MNSTPSSKTSAISAAGSTAAQTLEHVSHESFGASRNRIVKANSDVDYGCVDWYNYATEARLVPSPSLG
jgi:hypothetical protein